MTAPRRRTITRASIRASIRGAVRARRAVALGGSLGAAVLLASCSRRAPSALAPEGSSAQRIAGVWWLMFGLAAVVYLVVGGFIVVALLRGRGTEDGRPSRVRDEQFIWLGGIVAPVAILGLLAVTTVRSTNDLRRVDAHPMRVEVTAKQWWWSVRYPQSGIVTANEIRVPVGRQVAVRLLSDNVIHSFWVPRLAGKMDLVPGQLNVLRFTVLHPGTYRGECAEYCGLQHANMNFLVIAQEGGDFERWAAGHRLPPSEPASEQAAAGQAAFQRMSCAGCHAVRGTQAAGDLGPDLTDFGGRRTIGSLAVPNDRSHLAGWILNSQTVKPGNLMPPIAVEPDDLQALIDYLESLR